MFRSPLISRKRRDLALGELRERYFAFKELLNANNNALQIIADLEHKLASPKSLTMGYLRSECTKISVETLKIIRNLEILSGQDHSSLVQSFDIIHPKIADTLAQSLVVDIQKYTIPLEELQAAQGDTVGAKGANLAEMKNVLYFNVPDGFVITTLAYERFYEHNRLRNQINSLKMNLDIHEGDTVKETSRRIREIILNAELPADLEDAVWQSYYILKDRFGPELRVAMRSSALAEDRGESSFAGMYESYLNVDEHGLLEAYKRVLASKYAAQAMYYKLNKGMRDEDIPMCVCCLGMVAATVSGVMYTQDPFSTERVFVSAAWGLGASIVSGEVGTQSFALDKQTGQVLEQRTPEQSAMLVCGRDSGTHLAAVSDLRKKAVCLTEENLMALFAIARQLEEHYGYPQDVEFSFAPKGELVLLQTRPLVSTPSTAADKTTRKDVSSDKILFQPAESETASLGVGAGLVHKVQSSGDLKGFPDAGVLVAHRLMPEWVEVLGRVKAVITEVGGVTGHMASIAREFRIPMLTGVRGALKELPEQEWITVDATYQTVYQGKVEALLEAIREPSDLIKGSPVYQTLEAVVARIAPLNLTNPRDRSFRASACRTLHDIMRFSHEEAINTMFAINDAHSVHRDFVFQLEMPVPLRVVVVDLGGGLNEEAKNQRTISLDNLLSIPMQALLQGMTTPGIQWAGHVPLGMKSFISVFANTLYDPLKHERELGARSYAILSHQYVNFSSRLGYHFSSLDAYCGDIRNNNYISFRFKGGAASQDKRNRRAQFIERVLKAHDFWADRTEDLVNGNFKKFSRKRTVDSLVMLGRLMGCARQLDVAMESPGHVDYFVKRFLDGRYNFFAPNGDST